VTNLHPTDPSPWQDSSVGARWKRVAGRTGIEVTALGLGGAPLASMPTVLGYEVPRDRAVDLVEHVLRSPIAVIDTSNGYNDGESERRIGEALRRAAGGTDAAVASRTVVITKVDARNGDYSGARVRQSVEESIERLGLDRLPLVHLHDPEFFEFDALTAPRGAVDTLMDLKASGLIGAIGVAGGHTPTLQRYVDLGVFDALLTHNRLTLVDRSAEPLVLDARSRGMAVFNAAIFGGGILANPRSGRATYAYRPASAPLRAAITAMADVCDDFGVPLAVAALHAALREPLVDCTLVGMSRPERVQWTLDAASQRLPDRLWPALAELLPSPENWVDADPHPQPDDKE